MPKNLILLLSTIMILGCCVKRQISIASDPPEATVFIDGEKQGKTPILIPFNFYGTREITVIKDGYHIVNKLEEVKTPFYQRFPLDFFVEFFVPISINDKHSFFYYLKPYTPVSDKEKKSLLDRANQQQPQQP